MGSKVSKGPLKTPFWSTRGLIDCKSFHIKVLRIQYNLIIYIYNPNKFPICLFYPSDLSISSIHNESTENAGELQVPRLPTGTFATFTRQSWIADVWNPRGLLDQICWVPRVSSSTGCDMWYVDHESGWLICMICTHSGCNDCYHIFYKRERSRNHPKPKYYLAPQPAYRMDMTGCKLWLC